jgi:hypothetical protein
MMKNTIRRKSSTGPNIQKGMTLKGFGIDSNGRPTEYYGHVSLDCQDDDLISLEIYEGAQDVHCAGNHLKNLTFPESVTSVICDPNVFEYETCKVPWVDVFYEYES